MFEAFYGSFWQHPLLLSVLPVAFIFRISGGESFFIRSLWIFTLLSILDPAMTGPLTAWANFSDTTSQNVMLFFVLLGDLRFFFFLQHFGRSGPDGAGAGSKRAWTSTVLLTFIVPLLQLALIKSFASAFEEPRHTFLAYELLFFLMATVFRFLLLPRRTMPSEHRTWLMAVAGYGMLYYALWASADVLILSGLDLGFGLRVLPNLLYYGGFLPFVYWTAPASLKGSQAR
jgi:hypothetical protein